MTDANRFLRHVVPGVTFVVEISILLCLAGWKPIAWLKSLDNDLLGVVIGSVVGTGGLGFLLSGVHYALYHSVYGCITSKCKCCRLCPDYREIIELAHSDRKLIVRTPATNTNGSHTTIKELEPGQLNLSVRGGWRVEQAFWLRHSLSENESANPHELSQGYAARIHATGTALLGTLLAGAVALAICLNHPSMCSCSSAGPIAVWMLLLVLHYWNYVQTVAHIQSVYEKLFWAVVQGAPNAKESVPNAKIEIMISEADQERRCGELCRKVFFKRRKEGSSG